MDNLLTYKDELTLVMTELSNHKDVRFIGYNTAYGHRFNDTLVNVPMSSCIEMPVAENLIMGVGIGMSLEGYRPIVCIERMDFLWACADAIVNHLDKAKELGWPALKVIIRTCVGGSAPLDPGCQHKGDYTEAFKRLLSAPVLAIKRCEDVAKVYKEAMEHDGPVMCVEYKDLYPTRSTVSSKLHNKR